MFGETRSGGDEEESCAEGEGGVIAKVSGTCSTITYGSAISLVMICFCLFV